MTKKKASSSILVPFNYPQAITPSGIIQIPPYPDPGVEYAGYCKVIGANGNYELRKQFKSYNTTNQVSAGGGGGFNFNLSLLNASGFQSYLKSIEISANLANIQWFSFFVSGTNVPFARINFHGATFEAHSLHFDVPIDLGTTGTVNIQGALVAAANDAVTITLNGWYEKL